MAAIYPDLEGKTVVLAGSGCGLGAALAGHFIRQNARVDVLDIADAPSRRLIEGVERTGGTIRYEQTNLADIAALRAAIGRIRNAFGPIDILMNDATYDERHATEDVTDKYWDQRIAFCRRSRAPVLRRPGGAAGYQNEAGWRHRQLRFGFLDDRSTRHGRLGRLQVGGVGPDPPAGPRLRSLRHPRQRHRARLDHDRAPARPLDHLAAKKEIYARQCLKRKLCSSDGAKVATCLASEEASGCTSQHYVVDGGWM